MAKFSLEQKSVLYAAKSLVLIISSMGEGKQVTTNACTGIAGTDCSGGLSGSISLSMERQADSGVR